MLVFSLLYLLFFCITHHHQQTSSIHLLPPLLHMSFQLGPLTNCILIYEWFYNQFSYRPYMSISSSTSTLHKKISLRSRQFHPFSLHHLLFFIYLILNFTTVYSIHTYDLTLLSLGAIPSLLVGASFIYLRPTPSFFNTVVSPHLFYHPSIYFHPTVKNFVTSLLGNPCLLLLHVS